MGAARGAVFFATPHFGSTLADVGWRLRRVPYAAPAPSLAKLAPGGLLVSFLCVCVCVCVCVCRMWYVAVRLCFNMRGSLHVPGQAGPGWVVSS